MADLTNNSSFVYNDDSDRVDRQNALKSNVNAIKAIAEAVRTTIGPKGLSKMVVDSVGEITITNDGSKILEEISIEHSAAKMVVDLAKTIKKNIGDGSSSVVVFTAELLSKMIEMISMGISPVFIYKGYATAIEETKKILERLAQPLSLDNKEFIRKIIINALNTKLQINGKEIIADIAIQAINSIQEKRTDKIEIDLDKIQVIKRQGEGIGDSKLISGIVIDKEIVHPMMPKIIKNAKIALIDGALEIVKTEFTSEIQIKNPNQVSEFLSKEESILKNLVEAIHNSGANIVICQKGIDETTQHYLNQYNISAVRRVKHSDMEKIALATGAKIITQVKSIIASDLGYAGSISENKIGKDYMVFIEQCKEPKSTTILIRGGSEHIIDELERIVKGILYLLKNLYENPKFVAGGGSIEIELRKRLLEFGRKIGGKEQIPIENFADALEIIPIILIENSGKDPLNIVPEIRSKVDSTKQQYIGYNSISDKIGNVIQDGIIEPLIVKKQIYTLAAEMAILITRIDDIIKSNKKKSPNV